VGTLATIVFAHAADEQGRELQGAAPHPLIELRNDLLSVRIHNASWETVLQELAHQTGIIINVEGRLSGVLSQEFQDLPLAQGLRRLFRDVNMLLLYTRGTQKSGAPERVVRVWLLPQQGGTVEERHRQHSLTKPMTKKHDQSGAVVQTWETPSGEEGAKPTDESTADDDQQKRLKALQGLAEQGNMEALQQALFDLDPTIQETAFALLAERDRQGAIAALLDVTRSAQPEVRLRAFEFFQQSAGEDDRMLLSALNEALDDEDANVRSYAIQALAERGGAGAIEFLRQAFHDPDPSVRMVVIDRVAPRGQGRLLLQEALSDADEVVRSLAASRLKQGTSAGR
jgi:hypothetical protein